MKLRLVSAVWILCLTPALVFAGQSSVDEAVVHGTINVVLGNEHGIVVLTDSRLTNAQTRQPLPTPSQKLFRLDDHTVCAIAGFAAAPAASGQSNSDGAPVSDPVPDLDTSTSAVIHEYIRQSAAQGPQSISERVKILALLFEVHLSAIANVRQVLGNPADTADAYRFQLMVAGFDTDGIPKIGRIELVMKTNTRAFISDIDEASISPVNQTLVAKLNGMFDVATQILDHPDLKPNDAAIREYADSMRADGGRSLTVEQMVALAKRLSFYTSQIHQGVGGPDQIAILTKQQAVKIDQQQFPDPPKTLSPFSLIVDSYFRGRNAIVFAKGVRLVCVRCSWNDSQRELDGNYFIGSEFTNSVVLYDGGAGSLGRTNHVNDTVLVLGPHADKDSAFVRKLISDFKWKGVLRPPPTAWPKNSP